MQSKCKESHKHQNYHPFSGLCKRWHSVPSMPEWCCWSTQHNILCCMSSHSRSTDPPSVVSGLSILFNCFSFEDMSRGFGEVDIKAETIAKAETGWSVPLSTNQMGKVVGIYISPLHSSIDNYSFALQLCVLSFNIIGSKPESKFLSVVR